MSSFTIIVVLVVVHGSLERRQLGWNVVSESEPQHIHQESHMLRSKLGLPPPGLEPSGHASVVTLVQRRFCSCHHEYVVHLCAKSASLAVEGCLESRCR